MTSVSIVQSTRNKIVIRNRYLLLASAVGMCGGFGYFILRTGSLLGWGSLIVSVYCCRLLYLELRGIIINKPYLSFPGRPLTWLPVFSLLRNRILFEQLEEITVLPPWSRMETVLLAGKFGRALLLFHSRNARRKFLDEMKEKLPGIKIYRAI